MSDSEEFFDEQNLSLYVANGDESSDSIEIVAPPNKPLPATPSSRNSAQTSESPRTESPRSNNNSPRWMPRLGRTASVSGDLKSPTPGVNEVLIGARRAKETIRLEEEVTSLRAENQEMLARLKRAEQRGEMYDKAKEKFAARFRALLEANQSQTQDRMREETQEALRAHQMTLSLMTQWREQLHSDGGRFVQMERALEGLRKECRFWKERGRHTEELAKAVVVLVRNNDGQIELQQHRLAEIIKKTREDFPVPTAKPEVSVLDELAPLETTEQLRSHFEKKGRDLPEQDLLAYVPRLASLSEKVKEFEYFLDLKKKRFEETKPQAISATAATGTTRGGQSADSAPLSSSSSSILPPKAIGAKAAQLTGDIKKGAARRLGGTVQTLVRERKTPQDFPFFDYNSVQHVQKVINFLGLRTNRRASMKVASPGGQPLSPVMDQLREEANKPVPNIEWICSEILVRKTKSKIDPDWTNNSGQTLLHLLCEHENTGKAVKHLITKEGFDVTKVDAQGLTSLHVACASGALDSVIILLKFGPRNVANTVCLQDLTPLHLAALCNNVSVCKVLLENGANGAPLDRHGSSPLIYAILNDKSASVKFLAEKVFGLVNTPDEDGNTPLLFAVYVSGSSVVSILLGAGANPNLANKLGFTPLWAAMQNDDADLVHFLLDFKPSEASLAINLDQQLGHFGNTILMQVIAFLPDTTCTSYVKLLLQRKANPNATNGERKTALFLATCFDKLDIIRLLIEARADCNAKDINANRPLHFAQSVDAISALVGSGSKINVKNRQGNTCLHVAFAFQNRHTASVLISSGASDQATNSDGESCADVAKYYSSKFAFPFFPGDAAFPETGGISFQT